MAGGAIGIYRYRKGKEHAEKRKEQPLANLLRNDLHLAEVENFDSEQGLAFLNAVQTLQGELALQGIDVNSMVADEIKKLSLALVPAITTHVAGKRLLF